uniref:Putative bZIP transcription factor 53-like isoform X1 n=1 Tax=Cymbidium ensifolium TaxID=78740 RepID=A0A5C1YU34_CYMEN|nr:putative bZIP transcription factor 53-like isoform X1 [Cymbidium ensifolium]
MDCAGQGTCHGLRSGSEISITIPFLTPKNPSNEFMDRSLSVSSVTWTLVTLFSASTLAYHSLLNFTCSEIWLFSSWSLHTSFTRSFKCFCFLIRDLLADSRFERIRFRFLSSISSRLSSSVDIYQIGERPCMMAKLTQQIT